MANRTEKDVALAVRFAVLRLEEVAQLAIWKSKAEASDTLVNYIMAQIRTCQISIATSGSEVEDPKKGDGPEGPPCPAGFEQEFGVCVPRD